MCLKKSEENKKKDTPKEESKIDISKINQSKKEQIQISDSQNENPPIKLVGLYDPGKNDLSLEMWSGTNGELIRDSIKRIEIIRDLRMGVFDILVGINLLREGLDIPECALVAILDADKEGFLRSETSLIQTIGRAARNIDGKVILYADKVTKSIDKAIKETERRRNIQLAYNKKNKIDAINFAPFNKTSLKLGGNKYSDELQLMADKLDVKSFCCEFNIIDNFWTARVTSHIPIKEVASHIKKEKRLFYY